MRAPDMCTQSPLGGQTTTRHCATTLPSGVKVRYLISHDCSYAKQSRAIAEVWSPTDLRWNQVATLGHHEWAGMFSPVNNPEAPYQDMDHAEELLDGHILFLLGEEA